jgi:hypothetical protein
MPWAGFKPTIPASERAKTVHALDRAATVTNYLRRYSKKSQHSIGNNGSSHCTQEPTGSLLNKQKLLSWPRNCQFFFFLSQKICQDILRSHDWTLSWTSWIRVHIFTDISVISFLYHNLHPCSQSGLFRSDLPNYVCMYVCTQFPVTPLRVHAIFYNVIEDLLHSSLVQ